MSTEPGRLLVIDDDEALGRTLASQLELYGHQVVAKTDGADALLVYDDVAPEVVVVDLRMSGLDGMQMLAAIRRRDPAASVILLSGDVDVRTTVRALRAGAEDVQTKPVDLDHLCAAIDRGLERSRTARAHRVASTQVSDPYGFFDDSPPMRRVTRLLEHLSQNTTPVLIVGEPGTGKGVVAQMLHQLSPRADRPFVRVARGLHGEDDGYAALAAAQDDGTASRGRGLLAMAAGGTLFLDDVGGLAPRVQDVLLAVLEDPASTVRVVAATARDLAEEVRAGTLRPDVYHRLSVLPLAIPALRNRGSDAIRGLALRTLQAQRFALGRGPVRISEEAYAVLAALTWPGNVRQLRDVIEESFIGALDAEALDPSHLRDALERSGLDAGVVRSSADEYSLEEAERRHIARVLARTGGHRTEAAKLLGITRTTLYKKMRDYGLEKIGND